MDVQIRPVEIEDAEKFFEILNNDNFVYFDSKVKSVKDEKDYIEKSINDNFKRPFAILYDKKVVGGIGIDIDYHRNFIGEIGYFIDEKYWGKGIAGEAVKLIEKECEKLEIKRIIILMDVENLASKRVPVKLGYEKEGVLKKNINNFGKYRDVFIYSKILE